MGDATRQRLLEVVSEVRKADPVKERWQVLKTDLGVVWTDRCEPFGNRGGPGD